MIEQPSIAIINTVLPDVRGMELFYQLRTHPLLCSTFVILANPQPTEDEILEGFCLHSDLHWQHPIDEAELTNILTQAAQHDANCIPRFKPDMFLQRYPSPFTRREQTKRTNPTERSD